MTFADDLRQALVALRAKAHGDIFLPSASAIEAAMHGNERAAKMVAEALHDTVPDLLERYQLTAASIAADLYELEREAVGAAGAFTPIVPDFSDSGAHALVGWATGTATSPEALLTLLEGGFDRRMWQAARDVYMITAVADPAAQGWKRHGVGDNCPFCNFLIARGGVYSETTVRFASHDHCNCTAAAAWDPTRTQALHLDAQGKRTQVSTRATRTDDEKRRADNERIAAWIEAHPGLG